MDRDRLPVFLSVTYPVVNGITIYSLNLARGLGRLGYPTRILLTEADTVLAGYDEKALEIPPDIEIARLPVKRSAGWGAHWGSLIRLLHANAPCVYIPNSDYRHSIVSPALRPEVLIVGIAHADEALHYDHIARLGRYWNQVVCVSREVEAQVRARFPELDARTTAILNGVETPAGYPEGRSFTGPLRLVYHGSLRQQQKRALEFPELLRRILASGVDASLTLIGSGPDEDALREAGRDLIASGSLVIEPPVPNEVIRERLREFHVYVLNSEFEGMPQALLEAMSQGCVPLVTTSSGTREVVRDGRNGYLVDLSDFDAFARRAMTLDWDRALLERLSRHAFESLSELGLRLEDMARGYDELFARLLPECNSAGFRVVPGPIEAPPTVVDGLSVFPTALEVDDPERGRFPSWGDVHDFKQTRSGEPAPDQVETPLLLAVHSLDAYHSTELALELGAALQARGYDVRLVVQRPAARGGLATGGLPVGIACKNRIAPVAGRTRALVRRYGPCTYVAFDRSTAEVTRGLPPEVRTVVLTHSGDVQWLHERSMLAHIDAFACTSPGIDIKLFREPPRETVRVATLPYPVHTPTALPHGSGENVLTALAYLGHLDGYAPDFGALRAVLQAVDAAGVSLRCVVACGPGTRHTALEEFRDIGTGISLEIAETAGRRELCAYMEPADLLLLPTPFQHVSLVVMDALCFGCVPTGVRCAGLDDSVPKAFSDGLVAPGDVDAMARHIVSLAGSREERRIRRVRLGEISQSRYPDVEAVADEWAVFLDEVWAMSLKYRRKRPGFVRRLAHSLRRRVGVTG